MKNHAGNHLGGNLDIVVFSRDRNSLLLKSIEAWKRQPYRFIILHNSRIAIPEESISTNFIYKHLPGMSYGERAGIASDYIRSPFATILADDEMLLESGVEVMLEKFESNPQLASIGAKVLGIHRYGKITTGAFAYRNMYEYQNSEIDIVNRLNKHLVEPINGEMPRASMYRLQRSEILKSILKLFSKLGFVESPYIFEVAGEFAVAASGPTSTLKELYWIRNWENRMIQRKDWDRTLSFTEWWLDESNIQKKEKVIQLLSNYAKIDFKETKRILDQYLDRRYQIELSGNRQVNRLKLSLSRMKQTLFVNRNMGEKTKNILRVIQQEDLGQQNSEKNSIACLCHDLLDRTGRVDS